MSKLRQHVPTYADDLTEPAEGDLTPFVVFTQLKKNGPYIYAGWLDAADPGMAVTFAKEHYGQDQECTHLWIVPRAYVAGMRMNLDASKEEVPERAYQLFTQKEAGDQHISGPTVNATSAFNALESAREVIANHDAYHNVWAIPVDEIIVTADDEVIWRHTDQTYRLARGYSQRVREKWKLIREQRAIDEYEKDDLKETF